MYHHQALPETYICTHKQNLVCFYSIKSKPICARKNKKKKESKPFHYYKRMVNRSLMINSTFDRCVVVSIVLRLVCINWLILVDCSMR